MIRKSIVTGKPLFNHPEKDGFANDVFLNVSGDIKSIQDKITETNKQISELQVKLAASQTRYASWSHLCATQKCDTNAKNIISTEQQNIATYSRQIGTLNDTLKSLKLSLETTSKIETDPILKEKQIEEKKNEDSSALKKTRTKWIAGIGLAVVLIGGIFFIIRAKRKKA